VNLRDKVSGRAVIARRYAQQGFTLVEMAIVLVIIGLIIGGILKGQEIVNNGRVKAQVAQIDAVKAALATFLDKYGYYPGDDNQTESQLGLTTATFDTAANGDGVIGGAGGAALLDNATIPAPSESNSVWYELEQANLLAGVQSSAGGAQVASDSFNLQGKINASFLTLADFGYVNSGATTTNKMVRISGVTNPNSPTIVMREQDASQIDLKYDDGLPATGQILAATYSAVSNCCLTAAGGAGTACTTTTSTVYGLTASSSTSGNYCSLLWVVQ
jgi:prepilin-type N-terminal cleavage/methylation domain-containing protein